MEATSIGIGGMVGGGIFAVLGLAVVMARGGTVIAFAIAGGVALLTAYAYAKLSVALPSQGGTVIFNHAYGKGMFTVSLNILLWLSYIIMLSLYAYAIGSYGATFFSANLQPTARHVLISGIIVAITLFNMLSADYIARAEDWIVAIKSLILAFFVVVGALGIKAARLAPATWASPLNLVAGVMIIFVAYEGFELIANTCADARNPERTLPRAFYASVGIVVALYLLIAAVTVGSLPLNSIATARDYALAAAAKPMLGQAGFVLIVVAALLSTTSAVNATLYGSARLSFIIAKDGELPASLERPIWHKPVEGLFVTSILTLVVANTLDLSSISTIGRAGFLIIFAAVNLANVRLRKQTQARSCISMIGALVCGPALAALI